MALRPNIQGVFFSAFPPNFHEFLTPLRSVQIWGERRPICRGYAFYKYPKLPKNGQKLSFSAPEIHRQNTPCNWVHQTPTLFNIKLHFLISYSLKSQNRFISYVRITFPAQGNDKTLTIGSSSIVCNPLDVCPL